MFKYVLLIQIMTQSNRIHFIIHFADQSQLSANSKKDSVGMPAFIHRPVLLSTVALRWLTVV